MAQLFLQQTLRKVLDFVIPPRCSACHQQLEKPHMLCGECWGKIQFIAKPYCNCCGTPFEVNVGDEMVCARCIQTPPPYAHARGLFVYNGVGKKLVLEFKHGDRTELVEFFCRLLQQNLGDYIKQSDVLVPVPLHWQRELVRMYNQAALIASRLEEKLGVIACSDALQRIKKTASQGHMKREERYKNVKGSIHLNSDFIKQLKGKRVLLIDDVITSGATVSECCRVLKPVAAEINVLSLGRVLL